MFSGKDTKYLESKWNELPEEVQEAAKSLGFTSDTWDNQSNDIYKRKWKKLSTDQKEAAEILGWDEDCRCEEQLNGLSMVLLLNHLSSSFFVWTAGKIKYDDCDWDELPETVQKAATFLGYSKRMWDSDKYPTDLDEYDWDDLTEDQRRACFVLGITGEDDWEED